MEGNAEFNMETEANKFSGLEKRVSEVSDKGTELHAEKKDVVQASDEIKAEGVLTDEEKNTSTPFTETEQSALEAEAKGMRLEELKEINAEQAPTRPLERKRNKAESQATRLDLKIVDERAKSEKRLAKLEEERDELLAEFKKKSDKLQGKADKDIVKLKRQIKSKVRRIANELRNNPDLDELRYTRDLADAHRETFGGDARTDTESEVIREKRDSAKEAPSVQEATGRIQEQKDRVGERRAQLLADQDALRQQYQDKLNTLQTRFKEKEADSQAKVSDLESERDQRISEYEELDQEITKIEQIKEMLDDAKADMREFDFSGAADVWADVENRAANTIGLEALDDRTEGIDAQLGKVLDSLKLLGKALGLGVKEAEEVIEAAHEAQAQTLEDELTGEALEKWTSYSEHTEALKQPYRDIIAGVRNKEEGVDDFDLFGVAKEQAKEYDKTKAKIRKSKAKFDKAMNKVYGTYEKLSGKLNSAAETAYGNLGSKADTLSAKIDLAQSTAEAAQEGDFPNKDSWLKKTFSKIFNKS
jgi:DNA repair exonuclease SbcCD ATPase subunit